jgi:hypothetical protein
MDLQMDAEMARNLSDSGLELGSELRLLIETCFAKEGIRLHSSFEKLVSWISTGRRGERVTIVSTACPAYSYEKADGAPPRYTYSGLAGDIGLAGRRFFRSIDSVHQVFREDLGISDLRHEVLVADFEGFTEASLRRVGVTAAEFGKKCLETARAYQDEGGSRIHSDMVSNVFGGRTRWMRELAEMLDRAEAGEFPALLDGERLRRIGDGRRAIFEEFFREPIDDDAMMEHVVCRRALELGTAGKLIWSKYRNPLILTVSDDEFSGFFGLSADVPILDMSGPE